MDQLQLSKKPIEQNKDSVKATKQVVSVCDAIFVLFEVNPFSAHLAT